MYKHIFIPLDESPCSNAAFQTALGLAARTQAKITAVHVVDLSGALPVFPDAGVPAAPWLDAAHAAGVAILAEASAAAQARGVSLESKLVTGPAIPEILKSAKQADADCIVMGSHGRTGIAHLVLGSIAEGVLHKAAVPVIIVHAPQAAKKPGLFRHILVAHDGSPQSAHAYSAAIELAGPDETELDVCHVVDLTNLARIVGTSYFAADAVIETFNEQGRAILESARRIRPSIRTHLLTGVPADEILDCAKKLRADLIVMGSAGRGGISRMLLGSVAESVMRGSSIPVLILTDAVPAAPTQPREQAVRLPVRQ